MALYRISFRIDGQLHHTTGESTYPPTGTMVEVDDKIAMDNVLMFIDGYMDVMKIEGVVNRSSIHYTITFV